MKKRMHNVSKKATAFLLLLTYIFLLMPTFSVSAARATKYSSPMVSLTWKDGKAPVPEKEGYGSCTVVVSLTGSTSEVVQVKVRTFEISAHVAYDYSEVNEVVMLSEENPSKEIVIYFESRSGKLGYTSTAVVDDDEIYGPQFGVTISSIKNAVADPKHCTLIAEIGYYDTIPIEKKNGKYVFEGTTDVMSSGILWGYQNLTNTSLGDDRVGYHAEIPVYGDDIINVVPAIQELQGSLYRGLSLRYLSNLGSSASYGFADTDLFTYYGYDLSKLLAFNAKYSLEFEKIENTTSGISSGIDLFIKNGKDSLAEPVSLQFHPLDLAANQTKETYNFHLIEDYSGLVDVKRNSKGGFLSLAEYTDPYIWLECYCYSETKMTISSTELWLTIIDTEAPKLLDAEILTQSGSNLFIRLMFSEPVQIASGFRLHITIGGVEYEMKCIGGEFTKNPVFALEEGFGDSFRASGEVKLAPTNGTGISDLFWNANNENNVCNLSAYTEVIGTIDIDTRTPKLDNADCTTASKDAQAHTVSVELSQMDADGKLYYAWSTSSDATTVTDWTEKTNFVIGTNSITEDSLNGDYYLHWKASGKNGRNTLYTYGPLTFKNTPTIKALTYAKENALQVSHEVPIEVALANELYYAWSTSGDAASITSWTQKADYVVGQNTIFGSKMHGNYYLHIKAINHAGANSYTTLWTSSQTYQFDGLPPTATSVTSDTAANALPQHTIRLVMQEQGFDDLKYVYLYVVDESGNILVNGRTVYGAEDRVDNILSFSGVNGTMELTYKFIGMPINTSAKYKVGFVFEDASGNKTDVTDILYSSAILFDSHGEFEVDVVEDPATEIESVKGYEVLISEDGKSYEFKFDLDTAYASGDKLGITRIEHNGKEIFRLDEDYSGTDPYTDGFGKKNGADYGIISIVYNPEKQSVTITVDENAKGYYDLSFFYNEKSATDVPVYFTTEDDVPANFYSISEEGLLNNRVWTFANKRFYRFVTSQNNLTEMLSYEITSERYAESGAAPIFSDKEKAYEYALFMELQDVSLVYLNETSASIVNLLNSGASGHFKKAIGETATAAMGQTWIRYKNTVWDTTETPNAQDYAYYFYSSTKETTLDYNKVMNSLVGDALESHAKKISNYDDGEWLYLTVNTGEVDGNGEPSYRKDAVFDDDLTYQGPFASEITYRGDTEIYSTTISGIQGYSEITEAYLLANYTFSSNGGRTVLYYREYNGKNNVGAYTEVIVEKGKSVKLKNLVTKTGLYEFIEFDGNGSRKYYVYADFYAPTLRYEYVQGNQNNEGYIDRYVNGSTIRTGTITLKEFVSNAAGYTPEYDPHAYLYVTSTSGKLLAFMTAKELKEMGGYTLTSDTVIVYIYDRLGNFASVTIRANESDLYAQGTIKDDEALVITVNRKADEIAIGGFKLYKDNVLVEMDFASTITLYESGSYTIELADIYGNTYSQTFVFQRPLPVVEFQSKDDKGDYVTMGGDVNASAYVVSLGANAYQVTASSEIRLKYDAEAEYEFTVLAGNPTLKHSRSNAQYVRIIDNGSQWMVKISHKKDPNTYIIVTCVQDIKAPEIYARAVAQEYSWNEENGIFNVLFTEKKSSHITVVNGQTLNCRYVSVDWTDENEIRSVTVKKDGKVIPMTEAQLRLRSITVSGFGVYTITVTDILNNASTLSFTIANETSLSYYIDGEKMAYSEDPMSLIQNGKYMDTQYTGKDAKIVLAEYGIVTFLYQNETGSGIYQIKYQAEGMELYYLNNKGFTFIQKVSAATGELFSTYSHDFVMNYEIKDGKLTLNLPKPADGWEFWQIRVTDFENTSPVVIQIERSNRAPSVRFIEKETGEFIETNNNNEEVYTGAKSTVIAYEPSLTKEIVKISVFYSEKETFDFYRKNESILYGEGKNISEISDEGYYKIETTDVFGNKQVIYLRIGFGFEAVVKIIYDNAESVDYSVEKSGSFTAKSNHSVQFTIWAEMSGCLVKAEKNGAEYTITPKASRKYFTFTISEIGEYKVLVDDGCGNELTFTVSIKAPTEIVYNDYLTGFNEKAPYRDQMYTNGTVSMNYDKFTSDGISYIFYRVTQNGETSTKHILYNLLTPAPLEYKAADFVNCIGKEGNGVYDVIFADEYGNYVHKTVKILDGGLLSVSRLIETSATPELLSLEQVLAKGAWSNRSVILSDQAEASVLKVDGEIVKAVGGEYILTFPPAFAEGYETHAVEYLDEYGNEYRFTVHLQKKTIEVSLVDGVDVIAVGDERYVKGSFGYTWTDPQVTAHYTLGSMTTNYQNGQMLSENGKYVLTFMDYAGNSVSKVISIDTMVSYKIIIGHVRVPNGIATNEIVTVSGDGESLQVVSIAMDGEVLATSDLVFRNHGVYEIEVADVIGNTDKITFAIFTHAVKEFDYTVKENYAISGVWLIDDADRLSYISSVSIDTEGKQNVHIAETGSYTVELKDLSSGVIYNLDISIDRTAPSVVLVGVDEGGTTRENITVMGLEKGDHVDIYRGKELIFSKTATKDVTDPPYITEPGSYRLVVSDEAGNAVEYEFTREFTSNAASNIIILMLLSLVGASGFIFLIVNGKAKVK